jgi:hypothetical protein
MNYFRLLLGIVFILAPFALGVNQYREAKTIILNDKIQAEIKKISDMDLDLYQTGYLVQEVYFKHGVFTEENRVLKGNCAVVNTEEN